MLFSIDLPNSSWAACSHWTASGPQIATLYFNGLPDKSRLTAVNARLSSRSSSFAVRACNCCGSEWFLLWRALGISVLELTKKPSAAVPDFFWHFTLCLFVGFSSIIRSLELTFVCAPRFWVTFVRALLFLFELYTRGTLSTLLTLGDVTSSVCVLHSRVLIVCVFVGGTEMGKLPLDGSTFDTSAISRQGGSIVAEGCQSTASVILFELSAGMQTR